MSFEAYYKARDTLLDFIRRDAVGPVDADEILVEPPLETYVCGVLWPKKNHMTQRTADGGEEPDTAMTDGSPEVETAEAISETSRYRPSVMAMSFVFPGDVKQVKVRFGGAWYSHHEEQGEHRTEHYYSRHSLDTGIISVRLEQGVCCYLLDNRMALRVSFRRKNRDGSCLWTISVENRQHFSRNEYENNSHAIFQCVLRICGPFCPIDRLGGAVGGADRQAQDLLYRHIHQYAAGHGCSVQWDDVERVEEIWSDFLPCVPVSQMIASVPDSNNICFHMNVWQDKTKQNAISDLRKYIFDYRRWSKKLEATAEELNTQYHDAARNAVNNINLCADRLEDGLRILETNAKAWTAFVWTNEAMKLQSAKKRNQRADQVSWYPFQLCYIVMCLPDLVDSNNAWHNTVDLLWFPTGGGKTEAYLGVAAFAIFYRRLSEQAGGVSVLMRYTLRMLTAQQFERAAALICECEIIRRRENLPGGEISIGMWVGGAVTPNHVISSTDDAPSAKRALQELQEGEVVSSSPVQISICPYCGKPLDLNHSFHIVNNTFRVRCSSLECPFHDDLPLVTVDDDIYARRPTLLISTIDKFARLAWEKRSKALFGLDKEETSLPPSLIIQDELHLISGPLGSISGLYEIAIENLCTKNGIGPKIIASTATVCNASGQIRALYGRDYFQFPPSGLDSRDSFFAREAKPDERPERLYVGYCETGGSLVDAIVRTFGSVSFALHYLHLTGTPDKIVDHFWTNVGYFNSLKDLGTADTLILDRVNAYAESLRQHKFKFFADQVNMPQFKLGEYEHGELTSRKSMHEITEVRTNLDNRHYPDEAAYSYILSSNMLSVGIDISRLGLMTVYGQPKTTAEYIQATSRVGRSNPGLVVTLLHMMRARDKGHFERFKGYHQTLNRMVEPTSAAPYACSALDKALHAVFVILIRHRIPDLCDDKEARNFRKHRADVQQVLSELLTKIHTQSSETYDYAEELLEDFIDQWEEEAKNKGSHFWYSLSNQPPESNDALLIPAEKAELGLFTPTMNSMRTVDTQSNVYLMGRET